jgi:endonuclease YncB( thermonuclease family)
VQLLGVDAPEAGTCAGPGAAERARELVEGQQVKIHQEPGVTVDKRGAELRYVQYQGPYYAHDLGKALVLDGLAQAYDGNGANATYLDLLTRLTQAAKDGHQGQFGPPCGKPMPSSSGGSGGVDVDVPGNGNLPDGALTGGYCARKWWC